MYTLQTCIKVAKCNVIFSLLLFILQNIVTIMNGGICDARVHVELVPVGGVGPITVWPHQHVLGLPLQLGRGVPQLLEGVIVVSLVDRDGMVEHLVLHRDLVLVRGLGPSGWVSFFILFAPALPVLRLVLSSSMGMARTSIFVLGTCAAAPHWSRVTRVMMAGQEQRRSPGRNMTPQFSGCSQSASRPPALPVPHSAQSPSGATSRVTCS